jgi:hypothetical protein
VKLSLSEKNQSFAYSLFQTNIWKGHKNKGEVSKNEGGIPKMCVSPREK